MKVLITYRIFSGIKSEKKKTLLLVHQHIDAIDYYKLVKFLMHS